MYLLVFLVLFLPSWLATRYFAREIEDLEPCLCDKDPCICRSWGVVSFLGFLGCMPILVIAILIFKDTFKFNDVMSLLGTVLLGPFFLYALLKTNTATRVFRHTGLLQQVRIGVLRTINFAPVTFILVFSAVNMINPVRV